MIFKGKEMRKRVGGNGERRQKNFDYIFKDYYGIFPIFLQKKWQLLFYAIPRTDKGVVIIIFVSSQVDR